MEDTRATIRHAAIDDAAAIAEIYNEAIHSTTATFDTEIQSVEERRRWLEAHDERHPVFVAELDGRVVGWAGLSKWSDRPAYDGTVESSFYVAQKYQGRGIGRALKERLVAEARRLGFYTMLARATAQNNASIHINKSCGFQDIGTMKEVGFKFGRKLDVHLMQLMLDESDATSIAAATDATGDRNAVRPEDLANRVVIDGALSSFRANKGWADKAIAQLPDDKLHVALDEHTNSIAVVMKHVAGNLASRWTDFLTSDGEKSWRNRDREFVDSFNNRGELLDCWERGWGCLFDTLGSLSPADLSKIVTIRGEPHSVPLAIHRSLAHCAYHIGQIMMIARILGGDNWETITIPRGGSSTHNARVWGQAQYGISANRQDGATGSSAEAT